MQLGALDDPLLLAQFDAPRQALAEHVVPVEAHLGGGRLFLGADQPPVGRRQSHQIAEFRLGHVEGIEGLFGRVAVDVVLGAAGRFLGGADGARHVAVVDVPPAVQGAVAAENGRVEQAVLVIQFPVGDLNVAHQVPHADLEIGQGNVGVDPGDDHAVELSGLGAGAGDAVELYARPLQQRLPPLGDHVHVPVGRVGAGGVVRQGVVDVVRHGERAARGRHFLQPGLEVAQVFLIDHGEENRRGRVDVLRPVALLPGHAGAGLGVEHREGRLGAGSRVALGQGRIVDRRHQIRIAEDEVGRPLDLAADGPHHLVVLQRGLNGLFQG